jgi:hypothetical protein
MPHSRLNDYFRVIWHRHTPVVLRLICHHNKHVRVKQGRKHMQIELPIGLQTLLSVQALDAAQKPVTLPKGSLAWSVSDTTNFSIVASADTLTATLTALGAGGTATVTVVDAADGLTGTATVDTVDKAVTIAIVAGAPTPVPAPVAAPAAPAAPAATAPEAPAAPPAA